MEMESPAENRQRYADRPALPEPVAGTIFPAGEVAGARMDGPAAQAVLEKLELDHIGILVKDLETAISTFRSLFGYRQATVPVVNTRQKVRVVFLEREGSLPLKLFEAVEPNSALARAARSGGVLHHLAYYTEDLEGTIESLVALGARVLSPPQPGEAFDDHPIAFLYAGSGMNVELVTTRNWRGRIRPAAARRTGSATGATVDDPVPGRKAGGSDGI